MKKRQSKNFKGVMHMKTVEDLLMQMEEHSSYRIDIHPPADAKAISEMKKNYPFVPSQVLDFYRVTDGVEIGVPGTEVYPVRKVLRYTDGSAASSRWLEIGAMSFGDPLQQMARLLCLIMKMATQFSLSGIHWWIFLPMNFRLLIRGCSYDKRRKASVDQRSSESCERCME